MLHKVTETISRSCLHICHIYLFLCNLKYKYIVRIVYTVLHIDYVLCGRTKEMIGFLNSTRRYINILDIDTYLLILIFFCECLQLEANWYWKVLCLCERMLKIRIVLCLFIDNMRWRQHSWMYTEIVHVPCDAEWYFCVLLLDRICVYWLL